MKKILSVLITMFFVSATVLADIQDAFVYFVGEDETLVEENKTYSNFVPDFYNGPVAIFGVYEKGTLILNNVVFKNNKGLLIESVGNVKIGDGSIFDSNKMNCILNEEGITDIGNGVVFNGNGGISDDYFDQVALCDSDGRMLFRNNVKFINNFSNNEFGGSALCNAGNIGFLPNAQFINNKSSYSGGAILNVEGTSEKQPTLYFLEGSFFDSNVAVSSGGAVYNGGNLYIQNGAKFLNNKSEADGGAIYNSGTLYLVTRNGDIEFTGNIAGNNTNNQRSNAIYDNKGKMEFTTGYGENIIFNDGISSYDTQSELEINGQGKIILNEDMSGYRGTVKLKSGTIQLGENGRFFNGKVKAEHGSTISLINDNYADYYWKTFVSFSGSTFLEIDASLGSLNDEFSLSDCDNNSKIILSNVNITNAKSIETSSGTFQVLWYNAINNKTDFTVDLKVNQEGKTIKFTKNSQHERNVDYEVLAQAQTFKQMVSDTTTYKVYNLNQDENLTLDLGNLAGEQLIINGNGYDITSNSKKGMSVGKDALENWKILKMENVKTISGFSSQFGGVIDNYGTTEIGSNTTFENNEVTGGGGVIYNNKQSAYVYIGRDVTFRNNTAFGGGAILNDDNANDSFISIGANAKFESNIAKEGGAIRNSGDMSFQKNASFISNQADIGSAIYNTEGGYIVFNDGAKFINNTNSAIYNKGTIDINAVTEDVEFTGNYIAIQNMLEGKINLVLNDNRSIIFNDELISYYKDTELNIYPCVSNLDFIDFTTGKVILNADMSNYTGNIFLCAATLELGQKGTMFNPDCKYEMYNATLNFANSVIQDYEFADSLKADGFLNLQVDANLKDEKMDTITADNFWGDADIKVTAINVVKDTDKKEEISLNFITGEDIKEVVESVDKAYSSVYEYDVTYDKETGNMNFLQGKVNPIATESSVSGLVGGYLSQAVTTNQIFTNMSNSINASKTSAKSKTPLYASAKTNQVFEQDGKIESGLWLRPYVVSDTIDVGIDSNIDNTVYGTLAGLDLAVGENKLVSFYLGYSSGKQEYESINMNQANYILGVSGMLFKYNWYLGATVNAGMNKITADNDFGSDDIDNVSYSIGFKGGYNFDLGKNWILQPNMILMYAGITSTDFTNNQGYEVKDDGINNILIQPGLRLDLSLTNGWTPYGLFDVAINTGESSAKVDGNETPALKLDPYFEYGVGVSKDFLNTPWSCYGQFTGKSGSRSGVGVNLGIKYKF